MLKRKRQRPQQINNEVSTDNSCNADAGGTSETKHLDHSSGVTTRNAKRVSDIKTTGGSFDYTSDGMSFDSENADDELLPDITMVSPSKQRNYMKDDIVWAPFIGNTGQFYWPAIVTSVSLPSVRFLYINESGSKKKVFKKHWKSLISFDNPIKNQELKELGEKHYVDFKDAYERVVAYLVRRQSTNLCARRFLTLSDDKVEQAKDCLFRLGVVKQPDDYECESDKDDGDNIDNERHCNDPAEDQDNETGIPNESQVLEKKDTKIEEILKDLETVPDELKVSSEEHKAMETEANDMLIVIQSEKCFAYLKKIKEGAEKSSRHKRFKTLGLSQGGFGPFTLCEDLKSQLLTVMDSHCEALDPDNEGVDTLYKYSVMLPEAIIYAITKVKKISRTIAKQYFDDTSSKVGIHEDAKK